MIKIGTSGFSFPDWKGKVYPGHVKSEQFLPYYEKELGFNAVELNFTYYTLPSAGVIEGLSKKTSDDFEFVVKGFKGMTHDPFDKRIPHKPDKAEIKLYYKYFHDSLEIIRKNNKLGAVLLQFPVFFYHTAENMEYLLNAKENLKDDTLVVEFRNSQWLNKETFAFLRDNEIAYCAVDEPVLPRLMPFTDDVTSDTAYIRFHGRNRDWFNSPVSTRYNYLYSDKELDEFLPSIKKMDKAAGKTYLFFNNCHSGNAAVNAKMMRDILEIPFAPPQRDLL
jgi:uncharacterized protein YecE (DUF72 family)